MVSPRVFSAQVTWPVVKGCPWGKGPPWIPKKADCDTLSPVPSPGLGQGGAGCAEWELRGGACGGGCVGTGAGDVSCGSFCWAVLIFCSGWSCCCSSAFGCPCLSWVWFGCALGGSACFGFSSLTSGFALKVASSSASDGSCKNAEDAVLAAGAGVL